MVRIPKRQSQRLASSAVGTAGVDPSGAMLVEGLSAAINPVLKRRKEAADTVSQNKLYNEFRMATRKNLQDNQNTFSEDPDKMPEQYVTSSYDLMNEIAEQAPNGAVKSSFLRSATSLVGARGEEATVWASAQRTANAVRDTGEAYNAHASEAYAAGQSGNLDALTEVFVASQGTDVAASVTLDEESLKELTTKGEKNIVEGYINGGVQDNPLAILEQIEEGTFEGYLTSEEIAKHKGRAEARIGKLEEEAAVQMLVNESEANREVYDSISNGTITMEQYATLDENGPMKGIADRVLFGKLPKQIPSTAEENRVLMQVNDLLGADGEYTEKGTFLGLPMGSPKTTFEDLVSFKNELLKKEEAGYISPSFSNKIQKQLIPFLEEDIIAQVSLGVYPSNEMSNKAILRDSFKKIEDSIGFWEVEQNTAAYTTRAQLFLERYSNMSDEDRKDRGKVNKEMDLAMEQAVRLEHPETSNLDDIPNWLLPKTGGAKRTKRVPSKVKPDVKTKIPEGRKLQYSPSNNVYFYIDANGKVVAVDAP